MVENIRGIQNPLTIIAIFAGLAEIAGTVALATVNREIQPTFVWFVMGFPVLLVLLCYKIDSTLDDSSIFVPV